MYKGGYLVFSARDACCKCAWLHGVVSPLLICVCKLSVFN